MTDIDQKIRARIDTFVADMQDLLSRAALDAVTASLREEFSKVRSGSGGVQGAKGLRGGKGVRGVAAARGARRKGEKRPAEAIAELSDRVLAYITKNPGEGVESMGKALGESTSDLTLPLKKLLVDKRISRKGQKRATKYSPRG